MQLFIKYAGLILLFLCRGPGLWGQPQILQFDHFGLLEGPPDSKVWDLYQDQFGFIWMITRKGLVRYNGTQMKTFSVPDRFLANKKKYLIADFSRIAEDVAGNLWINIYGGFLKWSRSDEKFTTLIPRKEDNSLLFEEPIRGIYIDPSGKFWTSTTQEGLFHFQLKNDQVADLQFVSQTGAIQDIACMDNGRMIFFALDKGLGVWNEEQGFELFQPFSGQADENRFESLTVTNDHRLFCGTYYGHLLEFHIPTKQFECLYQYEDQSYLNHINALHHDRSGNLWVGWFRRKLENKDLFDLRTRQFVETKQVINFQFINDGLVGVESILEDKSGMIWWASQNGGLYKYTPWANQFKLLPIDLSSGNYQTERFHKIRVDRKNRIWLAGTEGFHLLLPDGQSLRTFPHNKENFIKFPNPDEYIIREMKNGTIWLISPGIVQRYDEQLERPVDLNLRFDEYDFNKIVIRDVLQADTILWISSRSGLYQINLMNRQVRRFTTEHGFQTNSIYDLYMDRRRNLWIGTGTHGFYKMDTKNEQLYPFNTTSTGDFAEDKAGNIWLAVAGKIGIVAAGSDSVRFYQQEQNLPTFFPTPILVDPQDHIWICDLNSFWRIGPKRETITNYPAKQAFSAKVHQMDAAKSKNGELFYLLEDKIMYFRPAEITSNEIEPLLSFNQFQILNQSETSTYYIAQTKQLTLPHWQNDFSVTFSAQHFKNPDKNQYQARLSPYQEDFQDLATQNAVTYTNLDPGHYVLQVKAANSDGIWNEAGIALDITIRPPWYWNIWSKLLYLLMAGTTAFLIYRFLLNRRLAIAEAEQLRELDELKNKLYTNITHEFRTPLTVIQGIAGQIQDYEEETTLIQNNSRQLLNLINEMLDLSKLEAGKMQLQLIQDDILSFLRYITESFHSLALNQKINLNFYAAQERIVMDYDPDKILKVLANLISNSLKFTPEYGKVLVTAQIQKSDHAKTSEVLELKVADTGPGIPQEHLPRIFDRFYQVDASNTRLAEGTGIGLAVTKELVELMNGSIEVESKFGKGSTFILQLPITNQAGHSDEVSDNRAELVYEHLIPFHQIDDTLPEPSISSSEEQPLLLIVEDNYDVRQYLTLCLKDDYTLHYAFNGQEGIDKALEIVPDIVISDVMMPMVDGFELCNTLKTDQRTSHIPIIILTAKADIDSKLEGLAYGADAYLTKPFHKEELYVRLQKLIELRKTLQKKYNQATFESQPETQQEDEFIISVRQLVLDNLDDDSFDINALCEALYLSRTHLHRKLKALTGQSTSHFIRQIRLQEAYKLLMNNSNMNVQEVAYAVGFKDPGYFSKLFSKYHGQAPSSIRTNIERDQRK